MIYADGKLVATNVETVTGAGNVKAATTRYMHYDPLGSIDMITGPRGEVVDRLSYDPFGARRPGDWKADGIVTLETFSNRGFTGHEHIDEIGLIHMNGRVYDAELGRFLSADKYIQAPYNTQSFNRYSYVWNNPLKYTDPSGWWVYNDVNDYYSGDGWYKSSGNDQQEKASITDWDNPDVKSFAVKLTYDRFDVIDNDSGETLSVSTSPLKIRITPDDGLGHVSILGVNAAARAAYELADELSETKEITTEIAITVAVTITARKLHLKSLTKKDKDIEDSLTVDSKEKAAKGRLRIDNGDFSQSEQNAAWFMASQGKKVHLRQPKGKRVDGGTSDLVVDGVNYDVYTPTTGNAGRIISAMAKKNSQTVGIVLDLSKTNVTAGQLGNALGRVNGSGATKIKDIVIMGK